MLYPSGPHTDIADQIVDQGDAYILRVKGNQGQLYDDLQDLFAGCEEIDFAGVPHDYHRTINKGHGRIEIRECWTLTDEQYLAYLPLRDDLAQPMHGCESAPRTAHQGPNPTRGGLLYFLL